MEDLQKNYTISETYDLPSKGLIYEEKVNPKIELRSMTARDEMKRQNPSATPLKTLADIIEGCMIEKPKIHVYDMVNGDYEYLLQKLRIVTYGPEYKVSVICPHCGEVIDTEAQLDELEVKQFDLEKFESLRTIILPVSGKGVKLRAQTPRMLDTLDAKVKELKRTHKGADFSLDTYAQLSLAIESVDGKKLSSVDLDYLIDDLPAKDLAKIINSVGALNEYVGLNNELNITCDKCGGEVSTSFRFGQEFFRPSNI